MDLWSRIDRGILRFQQGWIAVDLPRTFDAWEKRLVAYFLAIGPDGRVKKISVISSGLKQPALETDITTLVKKWKFPTRAGKNGADVRLGRRRGPRLSRARCRVVARAERVLESSV